MSFKQVMLDKGKELMHEFCEANALAPPHVAAHPRERWRVASACAYYRPTLISICPDRCSSIGAAGMAWSYPGYKIDRTPYGVVQHELGHPVDYLRSKVKGAYGGDFSVKLREITGEEKISGYCPNDWEWFAEIFRLYVTNSDLLRIMRPRTYAKLKDIYRPVVDAPWRVVLKSAPERTIEMAARYEQK